MIRVLNLFALISSEHPSYLSFCYIMTPKLSLILIKMVDNRMHLFGCLNQNIEITVKSENMINIEPVEHYMAIALTCHAT